MTLDRSARAQLAFRVLFSSIFVAAGVKHLVSTDAVAARLAHAAHGDLFAALASPRVLVVLAGVALIAGGLALLLGVATRAAAALLIAVLIPITLSVQIGNPEGTGPLFKNMAILGGLIHFVAFGAGAASIDALRPVRRKLVLAAAGAIGLASIGAAVPALASTPKVVVAQKERVLFLVQQPPQLKAAIDTGVEALAGKGFAAQSVEIVVCGPAITSLLAGDAMEPKLASAHQAGVRIVACGLTLAEKGIDRAKVSSEVEVVDNGLVETLQRKAEGYRSVEL